MRKIVQLIVTDDLREEGAMCLTDDGVIWLLKFQGGDTTKPFQWIRSDWNGLPFIEPVKST